MPEESMETRSGKTHLDPIFAVLCAALAFLGGIVAGWLMPARVDIGVRMATSVMGGVYSWLTLTGLVACKTESGRLRALIAVTSALFLVAGAIATVALSLFGSSVLGVGATYGVLATLYAMIAVGLVRADP